MSNFDAEYKAEVVIDWIKALAANEYPQSARGTLKNSEGYCCLGVLNNDLKLRDTGKNKFGVLTSFLDFDDEGYDPVPEAGIRRMVQNDLAAMNDGGASFPEIAKQLISNPDKFFIPAVANQIKEYFYK